MTRRNDRPGPTRDHIIGVRLGDGILEALDAWRATRDLDRSTAVRAILATALNADRAVAPRSPTSEGL